MDGTCQFHSQRLIDQPMGCDPRQVVKNRALYTNAEMTFALWACTGMTCMLFRLINHLQECGLKLINKFFLNVVLDGHG